MRAIPVREAGWLVTRFIPLEELRAPPSEDGSASVGGGEALPASASNPGWPEWIAGIHSDEMAYWFHRWNDAGGTSSTGFVSDVARYARQYPPPVPPDPPPGKANNDGLTLYRPRENQQQGSCTFDEVPYD